jgi:putative inorganic carbon (HCO3(-)) transporter
VTATSPSLLSGADRAGRIGMLVALVAAAIAGAAIGLTGSFVATLVLAGAAVLALMVVAPPLATLVFAFALYINVPAVAVQEHGVPYLLAAAPMALLFIPFAVVVSRRQPIVVVPALIFTGLYLLVLLIAAAQAVNVDVAIGQVQVHLAEGLLLVFLVTNVVRTPRTLVWVATALVAAGVFMGSLTLVQEITGTYDSTYGGFARVAEGARLGEAGEIVRAGGPVAEQNRYAQILLTLVPLGIYLAVLGRGWLRPFGAAAVFIAVAAMFLTFSRGAAIALLAMAALAVGLRIVGARIGLTLAALAVVGLVLLAPGYVERVGTLGDVGADVAAGEEATDMSILGRITLNIAAWEVFLDRPLLGAGPGNFSELSVAYSRQVGLRPFDTPFEAHNLYLEVLADSGIIGFAAFALLIGYLIVGLLRRRRELRAVDPRMAALATAILFALVAYLATGTFLHLSYERYFWMLVAIAGAAISVLRPIVDERPTGADAA